MQTESIFPDWAEPPSAVSLSTTSVDVWGASLSQPTEVVDRFAGYLNAEEIARADRMKYPGGRSDSIVSRGLLRWLLAQYLGGLPVEIEVETQLHGKPSLGRMPSGQPMALRFNLSHSAGAVVFAVTGERAIGIDIEKQRTDLRFEDLAERFFSELERATLRAIPANEKMAAFFRCWTRKEAVLKAIGTGLTTPLDRFDVTLAPGEPASMLGFRWEGIPHRNWKLSDLKIGSGWAGALAVESRVGKLNYYRWHGF